MNANGDVRSIDSTEDDTRSRTLFSEEHVVPILIGAKVALLQPPRSLGVHIPPDAPKQTATQEGSSRAVKAPDVRLRHWWYVHGEHVLNQLCQELNISPEMLPESPLPSVAQALAASLPTNSEFQLQVALLLLRLSLNATAAQETPQLPSPTDNLELADSDTATRLGYTAPTRAFLFHILSILAIPSQALREAERELADQLYEQLHSVERSKAQSDTEALRKKREHGWGGQWGKWAATGVGVVLGGVAIGVTGGLAAPVLLPLLGPLVPLLGLSAITAPIVIGSVFGLAGGGLTGYRVRRRWAGVDHFEFVDVSSERRRPPPEVEVSAIQKARAAWAGATETVKAGTELAVDGVKGIGQRHEPAADKAPVTYEVYQSTRMPEPQIVPTAPSLTATILVPGLMINGRDESLIAARNAVAHGMFSFPRRDVWVCSHSPDVMLEVGRTLRDWIVDTLAKRVGTQVLGMTALGAVMSALALPVGIYMATGMVVDNDWVRACDKASKAGHLLAEVLRQRVQGARPCVLVGSSLGSVVVMAALLELAAEVERLEREALAPAKSTEQSALNTQFARLFQRKEAPTLPSPAPPPSESAQVYTPRPNRPWDRVRGFSTKLSGQPSTPSTPYTPAAPTPTEQTGLASSFFARHFTASERTATPSPEPHAEPLPPYTAQPEPAAYKSEPVELPLPKLPLPLVDTVIFISSPLAPSRKEWLRVRRVVARRIVNAYCKSDLVLAGVGRLHEVVGGVTLRDVSGLGPVMVKKKVQDAKDAKEGNPLVGEAGDVHELGYEKGTPAVDGKEKQNDEPAAEDDSEEYAIVENIDISDVIEGHFDISTCYEAILRKVGAAD